MLKIEDLKEGEIYLYDYNWLSKFPKGGALNINTRDWREEKKWWWILNIKPATPEQKHWFKECEKANKFIPYEEAMKTFKQENESLVGRYAKYNSKWNTLGNYKCYNDIDFNKAYKISFEGNHHFKNCSGKCVTIAEIYPGAWTPIEVLTLMPKGWSPEQDNKQEFIVGKWYKFNNKWYAKMYSQSRCSESIDCDGKYEKSIADIDLSGKNKNNHLLTDLSEIQPYLPDNHPDKIVKQENYEYGVVHCKTQEEWDFVISKLKNSPGSHGFKNLDTDNDKGNCIHFVDDKSLGFCWKNYYLINKGYKIYSFEEWCEKFGHKPDFMNKQEEWIPKVGDWVVYIGNNRDSSEAIKGKAYKLKKVGVYFPELEGLSEAQDEVLLSNLRKALPHEIPQESSNSIPEYVEITEDLFSNCGEKYKKGKIYKAYYYSDDFQGFIWMKDGKEIKDAYSKKYFKPSTKSEYLKQQYPLTTEQCISNNDIIEVGDEVEIIKNGDGNFSSNFTGYRFIVKEIYKGLNIYLREFKGESTGIDISYCKLIKKASQTTNYIHEKQVDSVSPQVNTDLILFKKAKKSKEIDILPVQSPIFVNQKVNNKKQLLILN